MTVRRGVVRQHVPSVAETPDAPMRAFDLPEHYDFMGTLAPLSMKGSDPCAKIGGREAWWAVRTPDGPATLHLRRTRAAEPASASEPVAAREQLIATGYGPGAGWVLGQADAVAGLRDDVAGFAVLAEQHPVVRAAWHAHPGLRMTATGRIFRHLFPVILTQKVTGLEAVRAYLGICRHFGEPAPGPFDGLVLPPDPEAIAATPYWAYHRFGLEQRRADTLRRAAAMAARLERAPDVATARRMLLSIPGIGEWTVAEVVRIAFGDPDEVTVGDYHIPNHVVFALTGAARAGARDGAPGRISSADARMLEVLEPFRPQRARAVQVLLTNGAAAPKFGPRSSVRSFAHF